MIITKSSLKTIFDELPDTVDIEDVFDKILLSAKLDRALDQLESGKYLTSEQLDDEIEKWG